MPRRRPATDRRRGGSHTVPIRTDDVPNVVGVDPGGTCGVALYNVRGFQSFHVPGPQAGRFIIERVNRLTVLSNVIIGCQRFIITGGAQTQQRDALHIIGELTAFSRDDKRVVLELQNSADAAAVGARETLERVGWWRPGMEHANDAARHAALTMLRHFPTMWYELTHVVESNQ